MKTSTNSVTCPRANHFLLFVISVVLYSTCACPRTEAAAQDQLSKGFKVTPDPSVKSFQALLSDSTGTFSLGFLRVNSKQLALAVIHVPSSEPLWLANPTQLAPWSDRTQLFFNGSLVISGTHAKVFWATGTQGDKVVLHDTSNLQVQKLDDSVSSVVWQSFDFPANTLVENQNFTSNMTLVSSNGLYSMRLGNDFIGLYAAFNEKSQQIYWRHKAMEAKADIIEGKGPIYARVESNGFMGMYQVGNPVAVDLQAFTSYQKNISGLLLVRLEPDGNLKGYYWDGSNWVLNYQAISNTCELPSPCGSYGLCTSGSGCSCLDNKTDVSSGKCFSSSSGGDFCRDDVEKENDFWVLRRNGVDLPFKELIRYKITSSLDQCEGFCENNCSCWGALYNNGSGFCYLVDYPIQTLLGVGDNSKVGYFKVRKGAGKKKMDVGFGFGIAALCAVIAVSIGAILFGSYKMWVRRRRVKQILEEEDGVSPGPYKNLGSASFRSIEMGNSRSS
ncbi:hypothetical protein ACOSP7_029876 [Xanthoceras sorbifolium]